ncbi:MAG TPA: multiheme c-type cytochrome, partial [Bacteroidota bacterium]|nr:multiheme c-type cytochrome [Bacteroidota bacterium]
MRSPNAGSGGLRAGGLKAALIALCCLLLGNSDRLTRSLIFLPGTQPGTVDTVASGGAAACAACHASGNGREVRISDEWAGGMMAHAARDPVFYAALAVANRYSAVTGDNTGEFCIRCHSPTGWLAARSEDITGQSLRGTDIDGVQCEYCHRIVDPLHPDSTAPPTVFPVPGYGNGMHMMQATSAVLRGPRGDSPAP